MGGCRNRTSLWCLNKSWEEEKMALPLVLIPAIIAGAGGIGAGINGAVKLNDANEIMSKATASHRSNLERFRLQNVETSGVMDTLGMLELSVFKSFGDFARLFEKIRDKPEFKREFHSGVSLPEFNPSEIKEVSIGAVALLNLLTGGAIGAAGGFAAAGATSAAVMALGTASTGTAIASLSGQAAINATLAALGGGSLATGGGGMALGSTVLGVSTLGVGLLVGGIIFSFSGSSLSNKADEAHSQVEIETASVERICCHLKDLRQSGKKFSNALTKVYNTYNRQFRDLRHTVNVLEKTDFRDFTDIEKHNLQNTILLVRLLHEMCKVNLVIHNEKNDDTNKVNHICIEKTVIDSEAVLKEIPTANIRNQQGDEWDEHLKSMTDEIDARLNSIV